MSTRRREGRGEALRCSARRQSPRRGAAGGDLLQSGQHALAALTSNCAHNNESRREASAAREGNGWAFRGDLKAGEKTWCNCGAVGWEKIAMFTWCCGGSVNVDVSLCVQWPRQPRTAHGASASQRRESCWRADTVLMAMLS